jgi:hypothetical protein
MKTNRTTPQWLVDKIWNYIQNHVVELPLKKFNLLEPSAGTGDLLNTKFLYKFDVMTIELNVEKCEVLSQKGFDPYHGDFLKMSIKEDKDVIVAAPPFNNNVDVEHIQKMYTLLNDDGIIVSLTTPYWMTNNEPHQVQFREWLKDKDHTIEMLPDMTFVEKGKTVPTGILIIRK